MSYIEMNKGWKTFGIIVVTLVVLIGLFCAIVAIMAHCNNVSFVAELQSWFETAKEVVPEPEEGETVVTTFVNTVKGIAC